MVTDNVVNMEQEIIDKDLAEPRITLDHVVKMMERVTYRHEQPVGTTSTFSHAYLDDKFFLVSGFTASVSLANFNAELGKKYARIDAESKALSKLYELEGYSLYSRLEQAA